MHSRRFASADGSADCAALIVTYNSGHDIEGLIETLRGSQDALNLRVVVIDNGSVDDTISLVERHDDVVLVRSGGNLGYAGAINVGRRHAGDCAAYLILNPDVALGSGAVQFLWNAVQQRGVGASVPRIVNEDGSIYESLRREPSIARSLGDAAQLYRLLPGNERAGEMVRSADVYGTRHSVDWATGAVMMISGQCDARVGDWDERFFLYSEETDYARRIRDAGFTIEYLPDAEVMHRIGGSGGPSALAALMAVNKVRYYEKFHGRAATAAFRSVAILHHLIRGRRAGDRATALTIARRSSWAKLPKAQPAQPVVPIRPVLPNQPVQR